MSARKRLGRARFRWEHRADLRLHDKYRDATMIHESKFVDNLSLCRSVSEVEGSIVECGTWRGGMSAAMAEVMPGRRSELFDSFDGLPAAGERDGSTAHEWIATGRTLAAPQEAAEDAMRRSGSLDYRIVRGWFEHTVPQFARTAPRIAVLRLDGDWYDSTMCCLTNLFSCVPDGGVVILDDYGYWEGCTRAVHDFLSSNQRTEPIQHTRRGVAYLVKGGGHAATSAGHAVSS